MDIYSTQSTLAQEQSERARLLTQMREMLSNNNSSSGSAQVSIRGKSAVASEQEELGRLRADVLRCHEEAASAKAGWERAEAQVASWKGEARSLRDKLLAVERVRSGVIL